MGSKLLSATITILSIFLSEPALAQESKSVSFVPEGYHSLTPTLVFKDTKKAIEFYKKAFAAEPKELIEHDGKVMHSEMKIGDSHLMMSDEFPDVDGSSLAPKDGPGHMSLYLYVKDVDAAYKTAIESGAKSKMEPLNMFWGDRYCSVQDPFGYVWQLATRKENLSQEEIQKRSKEFFSSAGKTQ